MKLKMRSTKEKPRTILADGLGVIDNHFKMDIEMNTNSKSPRKQSKLRLVRNTGLALGDRGDVNQLLDAFAAMDDRASRLICRLALVHAKNHPRAACGNLQLVNAKRGAA